MSQSRVGGNSNSFNQNSFNTFTNVYNVNNFGGAGKRAEILTWLSPLEPGIRHKHISDHRVKDVGDWLLRTEEYRDWFGGVRNGEPDNSALFCYGDPGVGKTYITSLVIDELCNRAKGQNVAVACFYFDFATEKEQSPTSVLGSLLKQVVSGLEKIPTKIADAFQEQGRAIGGRKLGLDETVEILQDILSSRPTFICIDGLDECKAEYRPKLLDSLKQILHKSLSTRVFLAGRLHIWEEVEKNVGGRVVAVSITPARDDIIRVLRAKLREDPTPDAMDQSLEEDIIKEIPETVSEIFLLVSLNIKAILEETTLHRRREKLGTITNGLGLGDAYDATIRRIKAQGKDRARLGMDALMWISRSERPLNVNEICHALAVEIGSTDINANNVPSIRTVLSCCQGLAAVDKGSSIIRLIHFTLKEYLSCHADLFDRPHSRIAETCLTYLNFQAVQGLSASSNHVPQGTPLLEYSSLYWGTHMRMEPSDRSRLLALDLLYQYDTHISAGLLWRSIVEWYFHFLKPFSALHCVSYFGISEVAIDLIGTERWDVNQRDRAGLTPLMWAARHGHEQVVELLLQQQSTQPDLRDVKYGRTALSWAAESGHEGVVRRFLGRLFVNPRGIARGLGITPEIMSLLFRRKYINPNIPDKAGRTPLSWAAENGHDGVVKLLLGREDLSPDRPDNDGRTPLWLAARNGHDGLVKILLERRDVSPNRPGTGGQTPLLRAAKNGHGGVVKLLVGREDVSPDMPDNSGQTLLLWAAENGDDGLVKILLARRDVSPDRPGMGGQTPLLQAAKNGHDEVVRLLLAREDVSPDRSNHAGDTPLLQAAKYGHDGVVTLLLAREDVSPDRPGRGGQTPFSWAARNGHAGLAKLLGPKRLQPQPRIRP